MRAGAAAAPRRGPSAWAFASIACVPASYRPEPSTRPPAVSDGEALYRHAASVARRRQRDRHRLARGLAILGEHDPRVEVGPRPWRVARALDPQRARGRAVALDPGEGEGGGEVQRRDLAPQVPLAGLREDRDRAGERRLSEAGADDERRELEPASRVARLCLEGVGAALDGEALARHGGARFRARGGARQVALREERPRVRLRQARRRPEVGEQGVHRREGQRRAPRSAHRTVHGELRVRRDARAERLDLRALERHGAPRDPHSPGAGEGKAGRGRGRRRAGRRAQRDLAGTPFAPSRSHPVVAQRSEPSARAATGTSAAREGSGEGGDVDPFDAHPDVGPRGSDDRERALANQAPAVPLRLEPLEQEAAGPGGARARSPPRGRHPSA